MSVLGETSGSGAKGTEYNSRYREHDVPPRRLAPFKPESSSVAVDAPMETITTNKLDFTEHAVQRQAPVKPTDNLYRAEGTLDFTSSYNTTFQGRTGERARPIRHDREREELDKFKGESSYKAEFREWSTHARERRPTEKYIPSTHKLDDSTTSRSAYREMKLHPREMIRRKEEMEFPQGPFEDSTGYRDAYKEYEIEPRPQKKGQEWAPPRVKFHGQTTKQSDFTGPYQPKRESCRPDRAAFTSNAPFQADTTNLSDFQPKPLGPRYFRELQQYVKPEERMDLATTSKTHYREWDIDRKRNAVEKPGSSHILRGTGTMAQTSGYNDDFIGHSSPRREIMKPKAGYEAPKGRFEGHSTTKGDYVAKEISPRESYRPQHEPLRSDAPFESSTENRVSFVEQPLLPRRQREHEVYVAPSVPIHATTTAMESFTGQFAPKRSSCKPNQTSIQSDAKFDPRTTFMDAFKEHEVSPRSRHQHEKYVPPEGTMYLRTNHQEAFRDLGPVARHAIVKPGSSHVMRGDGQFANSSSYMGDFAARPVEARRLARPPNEYVPSSDRFEAVSTHKASFTGPYAPKRASCKPPPHPLQDLNAFEDNLQKNQYWRDVNPQVPPVSV